MRRLDDQLRAIDRLEFHLARTEGIAALLLTGEGGGEQRLRDRRRCATRIQRRAGTGRARARRRYARAMTRT